MLYGQPGAGKTTLAGTAQLVPSMKDTIFIDAESGTLSLADKSDIDFIRISSFHQFSQIYEFLKLHCRFRDNSDNVAIEKLHEKYNADPTKRYNTVVIDSLTEVQKLVMYMLMGKEVGNVKLDSIPDQPEYKEWGQSAEMIRMLIRSFRDLPMHVIFVAAESEDKIGTNLIKRPNLPGKLSSESQGFLDVVGYLAVRHTTDEEGETLVKRRLFLTPGRTFQAKHRFAANGLSHIDNPTMEQIISLSMKGTISNG
jgi:hypothetical protein